MRWSKTLWVCAFAYLGPASTEAQPVTIRRDPRIEEMVRAVSPAEIERTIRTLAAFYTRHTLSTQRDPRVGIGAAARWIEAEMRRYSQVSGGRLRVELDTFTLNPDGRRVDRRVRLANILGILPARDPQNKQVILVGAHYDSRASDVMDSTSYAPGANDDASGVAVVLELARILSRYEYDATIVLAAFAGEEQGLLGSEHLAQRAKREGWNIIAMITNDIVGNTEGDRGLKDNQRLRVFSEGVPAAETPEEAQLRQSIGGENDSPARQLARYIKEVGERYVDHFEVKLIYRRDRFLRGGDHIPFSRQGFPAVRLTEMHEHFDRQHQNVRREAGRSFGDLPEFVDFAYVAQVARLNLAVVANLAWAPAAPQEVEIDISELSNDTTLRWKPGTTPPDLAGYYVLIRETTSPVWERKLFVGNRTEVTLVGYSKDNYFFAVQAVDEQGHESLMIWPRPARRRSP
ncbi:MAG: M20/M25/M40 family metallo-hydrolase [Bacteroidota bacterium]|nr:M20/M25/M40 family metallo-hydrolase [Rhodothermia bacterium]MCS7155836.1 M20/M25/M40 family metallo-hydrolase [Bacteroidota bacterium]MDW8138191.1 M20/M25/M40 family metallo-hydrolase [Bacteroidota bacterium]MDW8285875.1 M20/M25/M40 family metallo-hydrolase [Bacteroidota bacterium]